MQETPVRFPGWEDPPEKGQAIPPPVFLSFTGGSVSKESACDAGGLGLIPGLKDALEEGMATHSSTLAWRIPWTEEPAGLESTGLQRVGQD